MILIQCDFCGTLINANIINSKIKKNTISLYINKEEYSYKFDLCDKCSENSLNYFRIEREKGDGKRF